MLLGFITQSLNNNIISSELNVQNICLQVHSLVFDEKGSFLLAILLKVAKL